MQKNILLINSKKEFGHSHGRLNQTLHDEAKIFLTNKGFNVKETIVDNGYKIEEEIEKILWADTIIYQMPAWWMGAPWILKRYIDDVFTSGHGKLYENDGRTRNDESKKYGSGGLLQKKSYMISITWNAPVEAFEDPKQFFEGVGIEGVCLPFHKLNQFLGMKPLPTFMCNDVMKEPNISSYIKNYKQHMEKYI